jgi:phosphatidylglycerol lysyltransferase
MRNLVNVTKPLSRRAALQQVPARDELRALVQKYGHNSSSYVLLEGPKSYFMTPGVEGFIAYQISVGVAVIGGDPVCAPERAAELLREFRAAMRPRAVCAYQVSPHLLPAFRAAGFDDAQIGAEALFELDKFTLKGGPMEPVRAATNKARREFVYVSEHDPFAPGAETDLINGEIRAVSDEWLATRGDREMGFLLGGLGLGQKSDKRYFLARSGAGHGRVEGFVVCEPIYGRNGYYLDVTRRRPDAVRGTMELLTAEICQKLHAEGYEVVSLGLAPLAQLDDPDLARHPRLAKIMRLIYDKSKRVYDFRHLYRYKSKYHPHLWERRYLCFTPRLSLRMFYALLQVRDAVGVREAIRRRPLASSPDVRPAPEPHKKLARLLNSWKGRVSGLVALAAALLPNN